MNALNTMNRLLVLLPMCLFCSGCGLSARQMQNLSDGLAGIEAAQPRVAHDPTAATILAGANDHIEAVAVEARELLPPPRRSPLTRPHHGRRRRLCVMPTMRSNPLRKPSAPSLGGAGSLASEPQCSACSASSQEQAVPPPTSLGGFSPQHPQGMKIGDAISRHTASATW